jgi:polar amino acid transport system substrate-binding protein
MRLFMKDMNMLKKSFVFILCSFLCFSLWRTESSARDLIANVGIIPPHAETGPDGKPRGGFVEIVKAIDAVYTDGSITIKLLPIGRSVDKLIDGQADFFIPYFRNNQVPAERLPFAYASEPILQASFVLYTRADRPELPMDRLEKYHVETLRGAALHFPFRIGETDGFDQGILRVVKGRSDGFIAEQDATDAFIRKHRIKNIRRTLYSTSDSCAMIPKGPRGKEIDRILSTALRTLKKSGKLQKITATIHKPYHDWQPYRMAW